MSKQSEIRWWFEKWTPFHARECDCKRCAPPLIVLIATELRSPNRQSRGVSASDFFYQRTRASRLLNLLEQANQVHGCYGRRRGETTYVLGSAAKCSHPENH